MKETVSEFTFIDRFDEIGRKDNFTREARRALFEYYEEMEADTGEEIDFDPIAICCDWSEYDNAGSWAEDYYDKAQFDQKLAEFIDNVDLDAGEVFRGEIDAPFLEELKEYTQVIEFDGGILVMAF